jgi:hypothetical protein
VASSGWQSEKLVTTYSANVSLYGNVYVESIEHVGTTVNLICKIAFGGRGTNGYSVYYNNGVQVSLNGGGWHGIVGGGVYITVGGNDFYYPSSGTRSVTITGVPADATSVGFNVRFRACNANDCSSTFFDVTKTWTLNFDASVTPPSGLTYSNQVVTWDSLTATIGASNWGSGGNQKVLLLKVLNESYISGMASLQETSTGANSATLTVTNMSEHNAGSTGTVPNLLGCGTYYPGVYAANGAAAARLARNAFTTPPAPGILSYTSSGNVYTFTYRGVPENNNPSYLASLLKRTFRYKINNGNWVYVDNAAQRAIDYENTVAINAAAGTSVTVEGWNTYGVSDLQSEVSTETITNTDNPVYLYGSVGGEAKKIDKLYASVLDESKELLYLYASVNGVAKRIFEA